MNFETIMVYVLPLVTLVAAILLFLIHVYGWGK